MMPLAKGTILAGMQKNNLFPYFLKHRVHAVTIYIGHFFETRQIYEAKK